MRIRGSCNSCLRVTVSDKSWKIEKFGEHTPDSHKNETPHRLKVAASIGIDAAIATDMQMSSTTVRRVVSRDDTRETTNIADHRKKQILRITFL